MANQIAPSTKSLSNLEHGLFNFDQAAIFNFFVLAQIQGRLSPEILRTALNTVQKKHYYLNVSIADNGLNQPQFIYHENSSIPLRFVEQPNEAADLQQAADELNIPFDHQQAPLVRAVVITTNPEKCSLIVTFSHIIADGMAGVLFVRDVLAICGQLLRGQSIPEPLPLPVLSPTDDLFPENHPEEVPSQDVPSPLPCSSPYVPFSKRRTHLIHHHFSENDTKQLIYKSHQEQTTVQGALCAALLLALQQKMYADLQAQPPVTITCNSPINLRHGRGYKISIPAEQIGFWMGWGKTDYQLEKDTTFWDLARKVRTHLTTIIGNHTCFNFKVLTQGLGKSPVEFTQSLEYRKPYLMITNLGNLAHQIPQTFGPLTLDHLHFGVSRQYCHSCKWSLSLAANTFNDRLTANFLYVEPFLNRQEANHLVQSCLKIINDHCLT